MSVVVRLAPAGSQNPDDVAAQAIRADARHEPAGRGDDGRAARREDVHALMASPAAVTGVAEEALNARLRRAFDRDAQRRLGVQRQRELAVARQLTLHADD